MEQIIGSLVGKRIDINCGTNAIFRGENLGYSDGVLTLKDESGRTIYIDGSRVVAVSEVSDPSVRPGFIV